MVTFMETERVFDSFHKLCIAKWQLASYSYKKEDTVDTCIAIGDGMQWSRVKGMKCRKNACNKPASLRVTHY